MVSIKIISAKVEDGEIVVRSRIDPENFLTGEPIEGQVNLTPRLDGLIDNPTIPFTVTNTGQPQEIVTNFTIIKSLGSPQEVTITALTNNPDSQDQEKIVIGSQESGMTKAVLVIGGSAIAGFAVSEVMRRR